MNWFWNLPWILQGVTAVAAITVVVCAVQILREHWLWWRTRKAWQKSTGTDPIPAEQGVDKLARRFPGGVPAMRRRPSRRPESASAETFPTGEVFLADLIGACRDAVKDQTP